MTGIIKTDQLQGAQGSSVTVPTGHTFAVTSNATVGGTLGVTGIGTFADDIVIGDGKTIGSASKTDAITIASSGLTQLRSTGIGAGSQVFQVIDDGATLFQLRAEDGNISFPQSGAGIYLGVTAGNSANLLNDYEEGTWTPAFQSTNASFSYGTQQGEYIKVGRIVYVSFRISLSGSPGGTTSNTTFLTGLPITIDSTNHYAASHVGHYFNLNKTDTDEEPAYQQAPGDTKMEIKMCGDLQGESNLTPAQMQSNFELRSAVTYLAGS